MALVGLLVYVLAGAGGPATVVLCHGADGHIALEFTPGSGCGPVSGNGPRTSSVSLVSENGKEDCGPCADLPVIAKAPHEEIVRGKRYSPDCQLFLASTRVIQSSESYAPSITRLLSVPLPETDPSLRSLRTVVLLI